MRGKKEYLCSDSSDKRRTIGGGSRRLGKKEYLSSDLGEKSRNIRGGAGKKKKGVPLVRFGRKESKHRRW